MRYYSSYDPSSLATQNQVNPRRAAHKCVQCACKKYGTHAQVLSQAPVHGHSKLTCVRSEKEGKQNAKNMKRRVWNKVVINSPTTAPSWFHNSLKQWIILISNTLFPTIPKTEKKHWQLIQPPITHQWLCYSSLLLRNVSNKHKVIETVWHTVNSPT